MVYEQWRSIIGACCVIVAVALWQINDMVIKKTEIQLSDVLFISNLVSGCCCLAYWYILQPKPGRNLLGNTKRERWTLFVFFVLQCTIYTYYYAVVRLPMGDFACIGLQAPLWIVFFSWLIFNAVLPPWYIYLSAVTLVVTGVILVSQPTFLMGSAAEDPLPMDGVIVAFMSALRFLLKTMIVQGASEAAGISLHSVQYQYVSDLACILIAVPLALALNTYWLHDEWLGTFSNFLRMDYTMWLVSIYVGVTYFIGGVLDTLAVK